MTLEHFDDHRIHAVRGRTNRIALALVAAWVVVCVLCVSMAV